MQIREFFALAGAPPLAVFCSLSVALADAMCVVSTIPRLITVLLAAALASWASGISRRMAAHRQRCLHGGRASQAGAVLLVVLLLTYILLLFSDAILRIIGRSGAAILVRVMGIILASLAVEIVLTTLGVASWAPVSR